MNIAQIMTRDVRIIDPDRTVREAARLMDELNVGSLPVCDGRRLLGMITDRDITVRSTAAGLSPDQSYVRDAMTDNVWWCYEDDDVDHIVELMGAHQIRRLPVVDREKHLVGIVALGDLATDVEEDASRALHRISSPSEPDRSGPVPTGRAGRTPTGVSRWLTAEERRVLEERRSAERGDWGYPRRRSTPTHRDASADRDRFRYRDEDDVRAAFGSFGHPGEERARNARMRGGYGGEGYQGYGDDVARPRHGRSGGYHPRRFGVATATGYFERPGYDSDWEDRRMQELERAWSLVHERRDHRNYGSGPGNTRFDNDATASRGEVRRGEHRGRGPRNYLRQDDRICEDINQLLTDDALIDASEIEVAVKDREVTLSGTVRDRHAKRRAEDLAESVSGILHVQNNLRISPSQEGQEARASESAAGPRSDERAMGQKDRQQGS